VSLTAVEDRLVLVFAFLLHVSFLQEQNKFAEVRDRWQVSTLTIDILTNVHLVPMSTYLTDVVIVGMCGKMCVCVCVCVRAEWTSINLHVCVDHRVLNLWRAMNAKIVHILFGDREEAKVYTVSMMCMVGMLYRNVQCPAMMKSSR
jgi:hypothetical protein